MILKINSMLFILLVFTCILNAEIVHSSKVLSEDNDTVIFLLNDSIYVNADSLNARYYRIELTAWIENRFLTIDQYNQNTIITKNALLYNSNNKIIGRVVHDFEAEISQPNNSSKTEVNLIGKIKKEDFYQQSFINFQLNKLLSSKNYSRSNFNIFLTNQNFLNWRTKKNGYECHVKYYTGGGGIKILLVFYNDSLLGIISAKYDKEKNDSNLRRFSYDYLLNNQEIINDFENNYLMDIEKSD